MGVWIRPDTKVATAGRREINPIAVIQVIFKIYYMKIFKVMVVYEKRQKGQTTNFEEIPQTEINDS